MKKFYRSHDHKILGGVAGGLADYFDIDPVIMRLLFIAACVSGLTIIAYIIAWIVVPQAPHEHA